LYTNNKNVPTQDKISQEIKDAVISSTKDENGLTNPSQSGSGLGGGAIDTGDVKSQGVDVNNPTSPNGTFKGDTGVNEGKKTNG
jgi:hypothetical protein